MKYNNIIILLLFTIITLISCEQPLTEKPKHLVKEDQMIDMMIDVHLAQSTFDNRQSRDSLLKNANATDFYESVLRKYNVPDSVFEQSFIYYASIPKKFEKMYRQVTDKLNELEQQYSETQKKEIDLEGNKKKK